MMKRIIRSIAARTRNLIHPPKRARRYAQLFDAVRETKARRILEIGTYFAARSKEMIAVAKQFHAARDIEFYGFDMFEDLSDERFKNEVTKKSPALADIQTVLEKTGVTVRLYRGDSQETLPKAVPDLPPMDVIFIDGGHSIATITSDWTNVEKLMSPHTVVIFDDYWPDRTDAGAKVVVDAIDRERYDVTVLPIVDVFDNPTHGRLTIQLARVTRKT